jgi:hypothetical protein
MSFVLPWVDKVKKESLEMAMKIAQTFGRTVDRCEGMLPGNSIPERTECINLVMDGLIGSLVMIACDHAKNSSMLFEQAIIDNIRHKFSEFRKISLGGDRVFEEIPLEESKSAQRRKSIIEQ